MNRRLRWIILAGAFSVAANLGMSAGISGSASPAKPARLETPVPSLLAEARAGFVTHLTRNANADTPAPVPPKGVLNLIEYPSAVGNLVAYLTPDPGDGRRHPAIIWITGGDNNTIGDVWTPEPADDDQTASAYRKAGIVMMYPSQRGGNRNPGRREGFLGECNDVLAAEKYLAALPYVDPKRIYLGGHSTGGTLALLIAELPNPFRAVFSYGPVANPVWYDNPDWTPFNTKNRKEVLLRSPAAWLTSVQVPTWVLEGTSKGVSNIADLQLMQRLPHNGRVHFAPLKGLDHFTELRPINAQIAQDILRDTNGEKAFTLRLHWPTSPR
jgi:acetyl esterase/lipase